MRLSEFVRDALTEIAVGVHQAKSDTIDIVAIVPGSMNGEVVTEKTYVEFDIAVTAADEAKKGGEISANVGSGISVLAAKLSASLSAKDTEETSEQRSTVSRIAFKVPVYLNAHFRSDPTAEKEAEYVRNRRPEQETET